MAATDVLLRIRGDSTSAVSSLRNVGDESDRLDRRARTAGDGANTLGGHLNTMSGKAEAAAVSVAKLGVAAVAAVGAAGIGALAYALTDGFSAAEEKTRILAQLNQVIKSTGGVAKLSGGELAAWADELEMAMAIDDAEILAGMNQLLTFTNVQGDVFKTATEAALNYSAATGKDLFSANLMLGKALNDPISGVTALQKAGVKLTDEQKDQVQSFMDVNDVAGAQNVILGEMSKQYGGAARAIGEQSPWSRLKLSIDNITEALGFALMPMMRGVAEWAQTKIVPAFSEWSKWMQDIWNGSGTGAEKLQASWDTFDDLLIKLGMSQDDAAELKTVFEDVGNAVKDIVVFVKDLTTGIKDNWDTVKPILEGLAGLWIAVKTQALLAGAAQLFGVGAGAGAGGKGAAAGKGAATAAAGAGGAGAGSALGKLAGFGAGGAFMAGLVNPDMLTSANWSVVGPKSIQDRFFGIVQGLNNINAAEKGHQVKSVQGWTTHFQGLLNMATGQTPKQRAAGSFIFGPQGFRGGQDAEQPQSVNSFRGLLGTLSQSHVPFLGNFAAGAGSLMDSFGQGMDSKKGWLQTVVEGILGFVKGFFGGSLPEWGPLAQGTSMFLGGQALIHRFGEGLHIGSKFVTDILNSITARFAGMMGGLGVAQWIPTVLQAMAITGTPLHYLPAILTRMNQESGGDPNAINLWDSNAARGDPSGGLMQNIGSAMASRLAGTGLPADMFNPLSSLVASMRYVQGTYGGDWNAVAAMPGGYASGGISLTPAFAEVSAGGPEIHLTKDNIKKFGLGGGNAFHFEIHSAATDTAQAADEMYRMVKSKLQRELRMA